MNKKILFSLLTVGVVVGAGVLATRAFFSDTETSTGNILQAGAIDLKVDNHSYYNGMSADGKLAEWPDNTWGLTDITNQLFFKFLDVKPGDLGEDTVSLHVDDNPAWACAGIRITANDDVTCTSSELKDDKTCDPNLTNNGELADQLNFIFWADDGDNVLEEGETPLAQGKASEVLNGVTWALADSEHNVWGGTTAPTPLDPAKTYYIGKAWCFGALAPANPLPVQLPPSEGNNPILRGAGVNCDGKLVNNAAQTDKVMGDIQFYAVQARNNSTFTCAENYRPVWPSEEEGPLVGAALGDYKQPDCDITVSNGEEEPNTITEGIAGAINGQTVCVDAGIYNEDVVINKEITLAGSGASATSVINGQTGGQGAAVRIASNNVTLEGFEINGAGIAALWLNTGVSGATVQYNKITSASGGVTAVTTQGSQSNHLFSNNKFVGTASGQVVYVNGTASLGQASSNVDFTNNTFDGTIVAGGEALGNEATGSDMNLNVFKSTLISTYAIAESWSASSVFHQNNFDGVGGIKVRNSDGSGTLNAENNWWGAAAPAGHTFGLVDDNPMEVSAFPEN